jgi:hydroxypyruvate reductase
MQAGNSALHRDQRNLLEEMFGVALVAVSAEMCLPTTLPPPPPGRQLILGLGKAAGAMVKVAMQYARPEAEGIILTRYGHGLPESELPANVVQHEAGHPLPDAHGIEATRAVLERVRQLGEGDQLLALVSGGGSAVLTLPAENVSLDDKQNITRKLLHSGASISQINCVRKHLSQVKGGRLALAAHPAQVVTLAFSDIPGDEAALIASGPTVPDRTRLDDARRVLEVTGVEVPASIAKALLDPANAAPDPAMPEFRNSITRVVARSQNALKVAGSLAHANGYRAVYLGDDLEGDASELGVIHAALALHHARKGGRWALLSGGETTVRVSNSAGRGGRNGEYLLSLAIALNGAQCISAIACDTDGIDGTQDNAGALIDPTTLQRARAAGLSPLEILQQNYTYDLFSALDDLVITGPTRTNVNDFRAILIDAPLRS